VCILPVSGSSERACRRIAQCSVEQIWKCGLLSPSPEEARRKRNRLSLDAQSISICRQTIHPPKTYENELKAIFIVSSYPFSRRRRCGSSGERRRDELRCSGRGKKCEDAEYDVSVVRAGTYDDLQACVEQSPSKHA